MTGRTARRRVLRVKAGAAVPTGGVPGNSGLDGETSGEWTQARADLLAVEEPLEVRVDGEALAVTMRTPGDDIDLAIGYLATEGVVARAADIATITLCDANTADVTLAEGVTLPAGRLRRTSWTTSACGVCGKDSIDAVRVRARYDVASDPAPVSAAVLAGLPATMRDTQRVFHQTGGLHAAGLFRTDGTLIAVREDVGRHNAVDKLAGWGLREGQLPLAGCVLLVSGRASFELVQKALVVGIPVLAAVSAPSSLAVELAEESGMTLVGFLRGDGMNVYSGGHRLTAG